MAEFFNFEFVDLQKVRIGLLIAAVAGISVILLFYFDFSDLSFNHNRSNYLGLIICLSLILSLVFSNMSERG